MAPAEEDSFLPAPSGAPRQRDLFPLKFCDEVVLDSSVKLSHGTRRRIAKHAHDSSWENDCISALNELAGHGLSAPVSASVSFAHQLNSHKT